MTSINPSEFESWKVEVDNKYTSKVYCSNFSAIGGPFYELQKVSRIYNALHTESAIVMDFILLDEFEKDDYISIQINDQNYNITSEAEVQHYSNLYSLAICLHRT